MSERFVPLGGEGRDTPVLPTSGMGAGKGAIAQLGYAPGGKDRGADLGSPLDDQFAEPQLFDATEYIDPELARPLSLAARFLVPPFSTLDARAGYWQERKRQWLALGMEGEVRPGDGAVLEAVEERAAYEAALPPDLDLGGPQGLESGEGRGGRLTLTGGPQVHDVGYYAKLRKWKADEQVREQIALASGQEYVRGEPPAPDPGGAFDSGSGRGAHLLSASTLRSSMGGDYDLAKGESAWGGAGTSIFDPVLCELLYRWFSPRGGYCLDPFAGGSVRGIVAAVLERRYLGIDLRPEQVAANERQREALRPYWAPGPDPEWAVGDSRRLREHAGEQADFIFTCPPYYDLEQYSDDPRDLSNAGSYAEFLAAYRDIIAESCERLAEHRFAAFVVSDIRGKDGLYLGLPAHTIAAFAECGVKLYNDCVLLNMVGSLPIRASAYFRRNRKIGRSHQQVLVFCKGKAEEANKACGPLGQVAVQSGVAAPTEEGEA